MREPTPLFRERTPGAAHEARTARSPNTLVIAAVSLGVGVLLAISGAFGTDEIPLWVRLAYWVPIMLIGSTIGMLITTRLVTLARWAGSPIAAWAFIVVMVSLPMCLFVVLGNHLAFGTRLSVAAIAAVAPSVLLISGLMTAISLALIQIPRETHAAPPSQPAGEPRFFARFPPHLKGARIFAVEADDHYLKVHTSRGTEMILMRLADAVSELEGVEGAQVHRSWWVARDAVEGAQREDGRATLTLPGGLEAPVSRTYARALREAGWF
jgi:hypothetical protein